MKIFIRIVFFIFLILFMGGCRKEFRIYPSHGDFRVSTDTVFLDSVFAGISSPTYSFKIYNRSNKTIRINNIETERGNTTKFRFNIDGDTGKVFRNIRIDPKDSIYVFVELTVDPASFSNPVYEEKLFIGDQSVTDTVLLTAFVKDAYFLYPKKFADRSVDSIQVGTYDNGQPIRVAGFYISNDTTITADKPVVIYGHLGVPAGKTLTIDPGAHLYFHYNSGIIVYEGGKILINGTLGNEVIMEDDRLQPEYDHAQGLWNFIWLREGSTGNEIHHAVIRNAIAGIIAYPPGNTNNTVLSIDNTQIYDCAAYGIIAIDSKIEGYNLVAGNFGASALSLQLGGHYRFAHCTFTNYSTGIRNIPNTAVYVSNQYTAYDSQGNPVILYDDLQQCQINNSIIFGNLPVEFYAVKNDAAALHFRLSHNLVKFSDPQHEITQDYLQWDNTTYFEQNVLNADPGFQNSEQDSLRIGLQSGAIGIGDPAVTQMFPLDILGIDRTDSPDAGAYKHADLGQ